MNFENRVIAITGAGNGLGRAYAHHLAALGAGIVVNNRRHAGEQQSSADRVVEEILAAGGRAVADYGSVEDESAGERLLSRALESYGRIDGLIANAGIIENRSFCKQTLPGLRQVLEINLMGTINVVHPVFRHMCGEKRGSIVVSTSSAGLFGEFGLPAYSASKAAVIGLMRSLSLEGAPKNVRVNAIAPYASTQMTAGHLSPEVNARLAPEQVAPVVSWLLGGTLSGEILLAGAGRVARAAMRAGRPHPLADIDGENPEALRSSPAEQSFPSAGSHFEAFICD